jgi:protein TonB
VKPPPAPKVEAPPPPYVPPPEIAPPVSVAPTITTAPEPPKVEYKIEPPPPPAPPPAPPAPPAGPVNIGVACPQQVKPEIPRKALQDGISGIVRAQAEIVDGVVKEVKILSGPRAYHGAVRAAMMQYSCTTTGTVTATQEFDFKIE